MSKHSRFYMTYLWEILSKERERRTAPRYQPNQSVSIELSWHDPSGRYEKVTGMLLDMSATGVLLLVSREPRLDRPAWVRLVGDKESDWVPVQLVGLDSVDDEHHRVRLRFQEFCPYDFFKRAVNGFEPKTGFMTLRQPLQELH